MLKIKDNVDLKELEKYGFKINKKAYYKAKRKDYYKNLSNGIINVEYNTRWICQDGISFLQIDEIEYQNILYDLIKDGLVEKVK